VKHLCHFLVPVLALTAALLMPFQMAHAQIPNPGFENWTAGSPDGWTSFNVTQSSVAHSGASAAQGTVQSVGGFGIPPTLTAGEEAVGFPLNLRPAALHGFYTFAPVGGDYFYVSTLLQKSGQGIGAGAIQIDAASSFYNEFVVDIFYASADVPDTAYITFSAVAPGGQWHVGTTFTVDDLSWGASSSVKELGADRPVQFNLEQNYPNPFNPTTRIKFGITDYEFVSLKVYDILGKEVATLVNENLRAGSYETTCAAGSLASGMYMYRLTAGGKVETRRMILMK